MSIRRSVATCPSRLAPYDPEESPISSDLFVDRIKAIADHGHGIAADEEVVTARDCLSARMKESSWMAFMENSFSEWAATLRMPRWFAWDDSLHSAAFALAIGRDRLETLVVSLPAGSAFRKAFAPILANMDWLQFTEELATPSRVPTRPPFGGAMVTRVSGEVGTSGSSGELATTGPVGSDGLSDMMRNLMLSAGAARQATEEALRAAGPHLEATASAAGATAGEGKATEVAAALEADVETFVQREVDAAIAAAAQAQSGAEGATASAEASRKATLAVLGRIREAERNTAAHRATTQQACDRQRAEVNAIAATIQTLTTAVTGLAARASAPPPAPVAARKTVTVKTSAAATRKALPTKRTVTARTSSGAAPPTRRALVPGGDDDDEDGGEDDEEDEDEDGEVGEDQLERIVRSTALSRERLQTLGGDDDLDMGDIEYIEPYENFDCMTCDDEEGTPSMMGPNFFALGKMSIRMWGGALVGTDGTVNKAFWDGWRSEVVANTPESHQQHALALYPGILAMCKTCNLGKLPKSIHNAFIKEIDRACNTAHWDVATGAHCKAQLTTSSMPRELQRRVGLYQLTQQRGGAGGMPAIGALARSTILNHAGQRLPSNAQIERENNRANITAPPRRNGAGAGLPPGAIGPNHARNKASRVARKERRATAAAAGAAGPEATAGNGPAPRRTR
jgi:hypothetical protein